MGEDATGIVGNLNPISLALQQVAAKKREKWSPDPQIPLQIPAAGPQLKDQIPEVLLISLSLIICTQMTSKGDIRSLKVRYSYNRTIYGGLKE